MQKYLHLLERIGLNEYERKVYLTLLEHPYLTVTDIAERTHSHRPIVYKSLRSLEADSLIEKSYLDGKRYYYHTTSPGRLREKLERINTIAESTLPELEAIYTKNMNAPILSIKEGINGIRSIHQDLLNSVPQ
jgi:sugar-specific transcriptional regulator TrmB